MKIFVYGTLKRGHALHDALQAQQFVGETRTAPQFRLFCLGSYPGMVMATSGAAGQAIEGEVWEVDDACLAQLDEIEAVDEGEYERVLIPLQQPFSGQHVQGYLYLGETDGLEEVGSRW
ncbi:MAG: gamma-glutamylaminecyclotransferase [Verrucomicrobiales bacterium]